MSFGMNAPTGLTAGRAASTGSNVRGLSPGMKHISGHHRFQQFTPEQLDLFNQLFGLTGPQSFLSQLVGGDEETFRQIEAPALRQFNEIAGGLASRFSGMGMGARGSSGFQNASTAAASNLAERLQGNRQALQRQALMDLSTIAQMLLGQQPFGLVEKAQRGPSGIGAGVGTLLGGLGGFALGGPPGALAGAQIGHSIGSPF